MEQQIAPQYSGGSVQMHTKLINVRKNVTVHGWIGIGRHARSQR